MPGNRRLKRLSEEKRTALLEAAWTEFADVGIEAASTNRITARAGISKGLLFYYFQDKQELLEELLSELQQRFFDQIGPPPPLTDAAGFWTVIERVYLQIAQLGVEEPRMGKLMRRLASTPDAPAIAPLLARTQEFIARLLDEGQRLGALRTDLPRALLQRATLGLAWGADTWLIETVATGGDSVQSAHTAFNLLRGFLQKPKK